MVTETKQRPGQWRWGVDKKSFSCIEFRDTGEARYVLFDGDGEGDPVMLGKRATLNYGGLWQSKSKLPKWAVRK